VVDCSSSVSSLIPDVHRAISIAFFVNIYVDYSVTLDSSKSVTEPWTDFSVSSVLGYSNHNTNLSVLSQFNGTNLSAVLRLELVR